MKTPILLSVLFACAVAASAQPADTAPKLVNDLPFPLLAPVKAQQLAVPGPIVIELKDATLGAALDKLKQQSGVGFRNFAGNSEEQLNTKLSVAINTLSFDEAFAQIFAAANLKAILQDWSGDGALQLVIGNDEAERQPRKSGAGLFGIAMANVYTNFSKSVDLTNFDAPQRAENGSLNVNLALQSDRRLPIVGKPQTRITRAEDDQGRSLVPQLDENQRAQNRVNRYSFYGNSSWEQKYAQISLNSPASDAKMLSHLEGFVIYAVVTKTEKWEVPDLLSQPSWTHTFTSAAGTVAVKIAATSNADDEEGGLKVKIEATTPNTDARGEGEMFDRVGYPLSQAWPLSAAMRIEDGNGKIYRSSGFDSSTSNEQTTKVSTTFLPDTYSEEEGAKAQLQGPFRLIMNAPVEVVQTEVPFAFENVPLP